ncbi:hypothetical protein BDR26DRAFT_50417 [Obelidium mucronatum]|nr:hypothetical protein BDR26DRAFT_50417 [Obelidium mucronatum]
MLGGMQEQYNQLEFESKQILEERNQLCVEVQHYEMLLQEQGKKYNKFSKELISEQEGGPHEQGRAVKMSCEREEEHRNSLANEIEDADAAPSENEALREEIVGLTQYINKLIQQINDAGLEQERRIDSSVVIPTAKRWTLGLRSFSGEKVVSESELPRVPVLEPIVFDHKEWTAKQALVARRNELGADAETLTLTHDNAEIPKRNTVLGSLSKTLGSWYSSPANRKNPDADENLPLGVIYKDSKPDFSSKITVAEITPQFHEIQKLERALPKIGYRQSRILENKRAIQY